MVEHVYISPFTGLSLSFFSPGSDFVFFLGGGVIINFLSFYCYFL